MLGMCPCKTSWKTVLRIRLSPHPDRRMIRHRGLTERGQSSYIGGHGDQRPHVELAIHWSPVNVQCVLALVDTGAECSLIHGNPEHFPRTPAVTNGYGSKAIRVKKAQITLEIGCFPPKDYTVYISPIPEYILGIDILQVL